MRVPGSLPIQLHGYPSRATAGGIRTLVAGLFGFVALMPYPAIPVGGSSGFQAGHLFALTALLLLALSSRFHRWMICWPLLVAPLMLSLVHVGFSGDGDFAIGVKSAISIAASLAALVTAQLVAPRVPVALLTGIACAAILHVVVGALQVYAFANGEFPLLGLYVNPSFLSVPDNAETIVRWVQRPFGLFPEPSAMAASLAPWIIVWAAILSGQSSMRQVPSPMQRALFAVAAVGSVLLIIVSRSGHIVFTMMAVLVLVVGWLRRAKAGPSSYLISLLCFALLIPGLLWLSSTSLSTRLTRTGVVENESWAMRWASMQHGVSLLFDGDAWTVFFGVGSGQLSALMYRATGFRAVWSILLTYVIETGLVGMAAVALIGGELHTAWRRARDRTVFMLVLFVWFAGITVTTSYVPLLALWVTLGWLSVWPEVADAR